VKVMINGESKENDAETLTELVQGYNLEKSLVVTEVDGKIVEREQWETFHLKQGMDIEIVHFVGGG
jgi:sulfur carrier protein